MALTANVVGSCKAVFIQASSYVSGTTGTIEILDYSTGTAAISNQTISFSGPTSAGVLNIAVSDLSISFGLLKINLIENNIIQASAAVLIHCDIDCCLVKLTNELIDCACDCAKCASSLAKAQKIFLLLQSALTAVQIINNSSTLQNQGYYLDALNKYNKAKELCDASCGCNC